MPRAPSGKPPGRPRRGVEVVTRPVTVRLEPAVDLRARCAAEVDGMKFAAWCAWAIAEAVKGRSMAGLQ